jgi:hypothetical protein
LLEQQKISALMFERLGLVYRVSGSERVYPQWIDMRFYTEEEYKQKLRVLEEIVRNEGIEDALRLFFEKMDLDSIVQIHSFE